MPAPPANLNPSPLSQPVTALWGVGAERAKLLAKLYIHTIEDLLLHKPRRYEDRRKFVTIRDLRVKETATVRGKIVAAGIKRWKKGTRAMFECVFDDGSALLHCRWWQAQPWMEEYFSAGREFVIFGKPESLKPRTIDHPETELVEDDGEELIHVNRIAPIHPLTEGITARVMRTLVWRTLEKFEPDIAEPFRSADIPVRSNVISQAGQSSSSAGTASPSPIEWERAGVKARTQWGSLFSHLPTRANAIRMIQFPEDFSDIEIARRRLALDEFVAFQFQIRQRRKKFESNAHALPCGGDNHLIKPFLTALGFKLTDAQTRVLRDIRGDLRSAHPMRRLLQGDVGSGKTVVAACSALMALESNFNVALMAPTEILAEQHFRNFQRWFEPLGLKVELQTGTRKMSRDERRVTSDEKNRAVRPATRHPSPVTLFLGTHALLTSGFDIPNLGLVIIDEQHKFGVAQREQLVRKGRYPHLLVMTATPIPRTLGLTLYGELDVSAIDELPAGRGRIKTLVRSAEKLPQVWTFVREKLKAGRQAYVVYPRVEDTGQAGVKAVTKEFANLQKLLVPYHVGMLHGQLNGRDKDQVMTAFRSGKTNVLLATSLIEVGVDLPNATVMLIENAEMFGLAQLHQLRGRVGRGAHESFCILISNAQDFTTRARLKVLEGTADGFKIAEADLKLRGPGELLGKEQSGMPDFRFGNLVEDLDLIQQARQVVTNMG
jgi:ATP-dependent DNA helicase RecG